MDNWVPDNPKPVVLSVNSLKMLSEWGMKFKLSSTGDIICIEL